MVGPGEKTNGARQIEHTYFSGNKKTLVSQPHMSGQTTKRSGGRYMHGRRGRTVLGKKHRGPGKKARKAGKKHSGAGKKVRKAGKKHRGAGTKVRKAGKKHRGAGKKARKAGKKDRGAGKKNRRVRKGRGWQRNKRCKGKFNKSGGCQKKKARRKRTRRKNLGRICKKRRKRTQKGNKFCQRRNGPRQGRIIHFGGIQDVCFQII